MSLALAIRLATVTWIATFFISAWLRLPWFVFFLSCCLLIIVGGLIALRYQGAERREGLVYVTAGLVFGTMSLFLPPGAPLYAVDVAWFLAIIITLGIILVVLVFIPDTRDKQERSKKVSTTLKQQKMNLAEIVVRQGKAYIPVMAPTDVGLLMHIEPVFVSDLTIEGLLNALEQALNTVHATMRQPTREEWRHWRSPVLKAAGVRSQKQMLKGAASYTIGWLDEETKLYSSHAGAATRWQDTTATECSFPKRLSEKIRPWLTAAP